MINVFKHLLPTGRAWTITADKTLRKFFESLVDLVSNPRDAADAVYSDIFPSTTRELDKFESQFGIGQITLPEAQRRERLAAAWRDVGGQSPAYIQGQLRANGFDVYVHEWWQPGTEPTVGTNTAATPRNPLTVLNPTYGAVMPGVDCGEELAACGEAFAECGNHLAGLEGYPLVNKFVYDSDDIGYTISSDPETWPFYMYVGGENFGDVAEIPAFRRYEFEALILRIRPTQLWIGVIVRYV